MNMEQLLEIGRVLVTLILGGLTLYFKASVKAQTKGKQVQAAIAEVTAKAVIFIKEAEAEYKDTTDMGGEKFALVVARLHGLIPTQLQGIITEQMIADIVQQTFDEIEEYVQLQLDRVVDVE